MGDDCEARVDVDEAFRAERVLPRRVSRTTPGWVPRDGDEMRKQIVSQLRGAQRLKDDLKPSTIDVKLRPFVKAVLEGEGDALDPRAEAVAAVLADYASMRDVYTNWPQAFVSLWVLTRGVAHALRCVVEWGRIVASGDTFGGSIALSTRAFGGDPHWDHPRADVLFRLYERVVQAPDDMHAEALAYAKSIYAASNPRLQRVLAFLFPDEPFPLPDVAVNAIYTATSLHDAVRVRKSIEDLVAIPGHWTDWTFREVADYLPGNVIDVLGVSAEPYLVELWKQIERETDEPNRVRQRACVQPALDAIQSRSRFAAMIGELGDWSRRPSVWCALAKRPALARAAADDVAKDKKLKPFADEVVVSLETHALPPWLAAAPVSWKRVAAPAFFAKLPPLVLRKGGALGDKAIESVRLLMTHGEGGAQPEYARLRELVTPESLHAFVTTLFQNWIDAKAPAKEKWVLSAAGRLGDDRFATELTTQLREWPARGFHQRAELGLEVLERIGTDLALQHLNGVATTSKFEGITKAAKARIAAIAKRRKLTPEELADRLVSSLDLGDKLEGTELVLALDDELEPTLRDADGAVVRAVPKGNKAASARFKQFKRESGEVVAILRARLESMMCTGRTLDAGAFKTFFVDHPVVGRFVRRVVWLDGKTPFRVDESGKLANIDDEPHTLSGAVSVAHIATLSPEVVARLSDLFASYRILQPFEQLARDAERDETLALEAAAAVKATKVAPKKLHALLSRGWRKGPVEDGGLIRWFERPIGDGQLILSFDFGIPVTGGQDDVAIAALEGPLGLIARSELAREARWLLAT